LVLWVPWVQLGRVLSSLIPDFLYWRLGVFERYTERARRVLFFAR
jgi:hypothetical protein